MDNVGKIELLMGVLNHLPNPVFIKDSNHVWVEANEAFCAMAGYSRDQMIGRTDYDFFPKEEADHFRQVDKAVLESHATNSEIVHSTKPNGETIWVETTKSYFRDAEGNAYLICVLTDLTELKRREKALEKAREVAQRASRSKSEFLANMSHEIRTPMNGVLGMSQILRRTELTEDQSEIVGMIERSGEALLTIINDILDFSKIEAGKFEIEAEPFSLAGVIDDVAALLGSGANEKGIELITDIAPDVPNYVIGDAGRVRQILTNLVGNAIKFTSEGHVLIKANGTVEDGKVWLSISVKDTGIGIPGNKLDTVFRQFEQADSSTTRRFGGTGLGLSICRSLVDAMGGHISVTSKPGLGSTFLVDLVLPVAEDEAWDEPESAALQDLSGVRALVIDDIALNCRIAIGQLGQYGIFADHETSPKEGLRRLAEAHNRHEPYQLLILDYQMPDMDGLKVAQLIRSKPAFKRLKIIVQSSVDTAEVKTAFLEAGISAFLVKPLRSGALGAAVNAAFSGAKPQAVARAAMARPEPARVGGRILIAEDNEVNQRVMAGLLANTGYELHFAGNGQVAVDLFRRNDYALVLMDVSMPVMDGMAATNAIRELEAGAGQKRTPIIAVTAHAMAEEAASFLERGVDQVLTKPINQAELFKALEHWGPAKSRQAA